MKQKAKQNGSDIYFKTYGENNGYSIFFVHGYLESSDIWDEFAPEFADEYFVVCVDLPGHGSTITMTETQSMGSMAGAVKAVAAHLGINQFHMVGHSMGGYVTMAVRDKFPEMLQSFVLFHSTCYADSEEKKMNRDREIELVRQGKKELIVNVNIPRGFANSNLKKLQDQVERARQIALKTRDDGIVAALKGMKVRPDRSLLFIAGGIPGLIVAGKMDNYIPYDNMKKMMKNSRDLELFTLGKSGHMGFIEEKDKAVKGLKDFFNRNFECI